MSNAEELLRELVLAIDRKWSGESERKRQNALSPRIEEALHQAKLHLGIPSSYKFEE